MTSIFQRKQSIDLEVGTMPPLELRFADSGTEGEITGYGATFGGKPDSYGDVIAAGAFTASLAAHKAARSAPSMLWSHDQSKVIGRWTEVREDANGLFVRGSLNLSTQLGRETHALVKAGDVSGMSIGYRVQDFERGRSRDEPDRILKAVDVLEISIVSLPANTRARISGFKSTLDTKADLVDLLRNAGIPKAAAQKIAAGGWPALNNPDEDLSALMAKIAGATDELKSLKGEPS